MPPGLAAILRLHPSTSPLLFSDSQQSLLPGGARTWKPLDIPPDPASLGVRVGTCGYHFNDWAGPFYPSRASRAWYPFYQLYFSFLEINHTFYQEPMLQQFLELERRSKPGMTFTVKTHRDISHKGVWDAEEGKALMRKHVTAVSPLVETGRFYSFLIQLDDRLERGRKVLDYLLATASAAVGEGLDVHVEFRNRTWHQEPVLQALKDAGVGICNTDIPKLPHAFPLKAYATSRKGYVRYSGLNLANWTQTGKAGSPADRLKARDARYDYDYSPAEIAERVRGQLELLRKTGSLAVAFNNHFRAKAVMNAIEDIYLLMGFLRS